MTETKQHASPHCPCPHTAITPMTSSINHNASAETNEHRNAKQTRSALPPTPAATTPRRDDKGYMNRGKHGTTPQGSQTQNRIPVRHHKTNAMPDETSRTTSRRKHHEPPYPPMTTRTIPIRQMTMRTTFQRNGITDKQHLNDRKPPRHE